MRRTKTAMVFLPTAVSAAVSVAVSVAISAASWLILATALASLPACKSRLPELVQRPPDPDRFPHERHGQLGCENCHEPADVLAGKPAIAGANDHAPCDDSGCHRDDFLGKPTPLCRICHESVDVQRGQAPMRPSPRTVGSVALAAEFDHSLHLDYGRMEKAVGFHVGCADCHLDEQANLSVPGHRQCSRCHAPEATFRKELDTAKSEVPPMTACSECHRTRTKQPFRERRLIVGDLRFRHEIHRGDRRGKLIRCVECHGETRTANETGDHPLPTTRNCVSCHDDSERVPQTKRMRVCQTCHRSRQSGLGSLAPRSHLPASERPLDHTIAFRRDHGPDAERDPTRCARCHTVLSGSPRQVCDECHQVMRPVDHTVTWREFDHGQDAAMEAARCTTCHSVDYCVTCHRQVPRSHFPLFEYRSGGHALAAELNLRSCVTCHSQLTLCSRSGCHQRTPATGR